MRLRVIFEKRRAPKVDPAMPPAKAARASRIRCGAKSTPPLQNFPANPAMELTRIKKADVAAVFLGSAQRNRMRIGLKKIPPPTPTIPEINPMTLPTSADMARDGGSVSFFPLDSFKSMRKQAKKRAPARSQL